MSEGCGGGWTTLVGFFLENSYVVEESCAPYEAGAGTISSCGNY